MFRRVLKGRVSGNARRYLFRDQLVDAVFIRPRNIAELIIEGFQDVGQTVQFRLGLVPAAACGNRLDLSILIGEFLDQHPRLRATRIYQMIRERGYAGSVVQLRRAVARLPPKSREAFLRLEMFSGEQAQVDWAHFGHLAGKCDSN